MMQGYLECVKCKKKYEESIKTLTCIHNKYYDYLEYKNVVPAKNTVTLGKGNTPMVKLKKTGAMIGCQELYVKDESKNPTGSFKDRESAVLIDKAVDFGIKDVFAISSGNAAISLSAYAKVAGIRCTCYIPDHASEGKKKMIQLFGGKIVEMAGTYEAVYRKILDENISGWNCTLNPFKSAGSKKIAWEIYEKVGMPDKIIVPCGNGSNLAGIWSGFKEIAQMKKIAKLPQMIGVQVEGASPLKSAMESGNDYEILSNIADSVAEGIVATESYSSPKALRALKESKGSVLEVNEGEIKSALRHMLIEESLVMEPTSASAFAGVWKLNISGKKVIVLLTSGGTNTLSEISDIVLGSR